MTRPVAAELRRAEAATWGSRPATAEPPRIRRWFPHRNAAGTVAGYLDAELASGLIVNDLRLMIGPTGKRWIGMPSVKQLDRAGQPRLGPDGKALWKDIVECRSKEVRERFEAAILDALRRQHPEAFS